MRTHSTNPSSSAPAPGVAAAPGTCEGMWERAGNVVGTLLATYWGSRRELRDAETCCKSARGSSSPEGFTAQRRHWRLWLEVLEDQSLPADLHPSGQRAEGWADKEAADAVTFASCAKGSGKKNASPTRCFASKPTARSCCCAPSEVPRAGAGLDLRPQFVSVALFLGLCEGRK